MGDPHLQDLLELLVKPQRWGCGRKAQHQCVLGEDHFKSKIRERNLDQKPGCPSLSASECQLSNSSLPRMIPQLVVEK